MIFFALGFLLYCYCNCNVVCGQTSFGIVTPDNSGGVPLVDEAFRVQYYLPNPSTNNVQIFFEPQSIDLAGTRTLTLNNTFKSQGIHSLFIKHLAVADA